MRKCSTDAVTQTRMMVRRPSSSPPLRILYILCMLYNGADLGTSCTVTSHYALDYPQVKQLKAQETSQKSFDTIHQCSDTEDKPVIVACLAGYDDEILNLMEEIKNEPCGKELKVNFYLFHKCKLYFLGQHTVDLKVLEDILCKYNHYVCLDKRYIDQYTEKDCLYMTRMTLVPGLEDDIRKDIPDARLNEDISALDIDIANKESRINILTQRDKEGDAVKQNFDVNLQKRRFTKPLPITVNTYRTHG